MAQWITRLTTDQKIPGSNPGKVVILIFSSLFETRTKGQNLSSLPWYDIFMPWPGFEPGLLRPQRKVLTTIRSRLNWGHVQLETSLHFNTCISRLKYANFTPHLWQYHEAVVAEWLRRLTRNQIPSGSVGSNPTDCARFFGIFFMSSSEAFPFSWTNSCFMTDYLPGSSCSEIYFESPKWIKIAF